MKTPLLLLLLLFVMVQAGRAQPLGARPRIGLTLSGGGARGLAHIGLLQALDSAGVPVDYVTGTSMGAIVGALYATGYSGHDIARMVRELDWDALLTNGAQLRTVTLVEKDDVSRYLIELPFVRRKLQPLSGVIESEELWLKLSELFLPYYRTKDFDQFQRGFRCVATDILSGEAVVLRRGEIVRAIRASMAIPSVFTPIYYEGHQLVDGGIVRNFPVSEVKAMGAGLIIGSNVSSGAYTEASLRNPLDVLLQITYFKDNADFKSQRPLCDVYIDYPLKGFTIGGFADAEPITRIGLRRGRQAFPLLKRLADSLDARYGPVSPSRLLPRLDSVYISSYETHGLEPRYVPLVLQMMQFRTGRSYTPVQLSAAVRRAFGTRYFRRLTYSLQPLPDGTAHIVFDAVRAPLTHLQFGLHYHSLTGIGLIGAISSKDWLLPFSTSQAVVNLGENPRLRLKHFQYLTKSKHTFLLLLAQAEQLDVTTHDADIHKAGLYSQRYGTVSGQLMREFNRNAALGVGTRYEYVSFQPKIASGLQLSGRLRLLTSFIAYEANTWNTALYPTAGRRVDAELGYVYGQVPAFRVLDGTTLVETEDAARFSFHPYLRARLNLEQFYPLSPRSTLLAQAQAGLNFNYRQVVVNDFVVGGLSPVLRNQLTFAGLPEAALLTSSAAAALVGYRYALAPKVFMAAKVNVLYHDFLATNLQLQPAKVLYGGALTLSYRSFLGPIDASLLYSDASKRVLPYFNIGIPFGYR